VPVITPNLMAAEPRVENTRATDISVGPHWPRHNLQDRFRPVRTLIEHAS
jgi:hypothetical protein